MTVCSSDILTITQNVLETMVNMGVCEGEVAEACSQEERMTGCVQISGTWRGAVVIQTTEGFVRHAAREMLDKAESDLTPEDLEDSLAEITNMIGGNIKSQVPSPSYLSLPSVTTGHDFNFRLTGAEIVSQMPMNSHNQPLNVLICEARE
jgi:chemotaxis protein CheX